MISRVVAGCLPHILPHKLPYRISLHRHLGATTKVPTEAAYFLISFRRVLASGEKPLCRRLWAAVLTAAMEDAVLRPDTLEGRRSAVWIREGGKWFRTICDLDGIDDPDELRRALIDGRFDPRRQGRSTPTLAQVAVANRRERVQSMRQAGAPGRQIAQALGVTLRTVKHDLAALQEGRVA